MSSLALELFDPKLVAVLRILQREKKVYLRECAKLSGVAPATTMRILQRLVSLTIVELTEIKHLKLYTLADSKEVRELMRCFV